MKPRLPYYEHVRCDYCGKEKSIILGADYHGLLTNEKTGWTYPVVERKD